MRRKRKRTRLRPKPFLWLLLVAAVATGIWTSSMTSLRHIRVEGALPGDQQRIGAILKKLENQPLVRIDPRATESQVLENSEIRKAELSRSLFGSALLRITYRRPVARLLGHPGVLLDEQGVLYQASSTPAEVPQVQLPTNGPPTLLTVSSNWQPRTMAKLAQDVLKLPISDVIRIQVEPGGVVCLNIGTGRVILGSLDDLDKKLSVLRQRLAINPNELNEVQELNLTASDNPSVVPKENNRP